MNIIKQPLKYTPSNNPVVFGFSETGDTVYYQVNVKEALTNATLYTGNLFPTPVQPDRVYFNASKILDSVVKYDVDNQTDLVLAKTQNILQYDVEVVPYEILSGSTQQQNTGYTTKDYYVWDAGSDIQTYTNVDDNTFIVKSGNTLARFLTLQPDKKKVNAYSNEQLYFIQDGYTALTANYKIGNASYQIPVTGQTLTGSTIIPATAETRAVGHVAITGTTTGVGDNIGIFVNGNLLGEYSSTSTGSSISQLAALLASNLGDNTSGYTITYTSGNTFSITAPAGTGAAANSYTLTAGLVVTGQTNGTVSGTSATAIISGYTLPAAGTETVVDVEDWQNGGLILGVYTVQVGDTTLNVYTDNLVDEINTNPYGYTATKITSSQIQVTARPDTGAEMNGNKVYYENSSSFTTIEGIFSGGVTTSTGSTTTFYSIIPNSLTGFTGGVTAVAQSTQTNFTNQIASMYRLRVSPSAIEELGTTLVAGDKYEVYLSEPSGSTLTETRIFQYEDSPCNVELVNVQWVNSLGGVDSIQMYNPQYSISVNKQTIQRNNIKLEQALVYQTSGKWNVAEETISTTNRTTIRLYTKPLTDDDSDWLSELVSSRQIYFELLDGSLLPVQLKTTNYSVQKKKYLTELNQYQFEFELDSNYNPSIHGGVHINQ